MSKARADSAAEFAKWLDEEARPKIPGPVDPADEVLVQSSRQRHRFQEPSA